MKIENPKFYGGKHQFADKITNYNTINAQNFWDLIPLKDFSESDIAVLKKNFEALAKQEINTIKRNDAITNLYNTAYEKIPTSKKTAFNDIFFKDEDNHPISFDAFLSFSEEDAKTAKKLYKKLFLSYLME